MAKHTAQDSKWKVLTLIHALKIGPPRHTEVKKWAKGNVTPKSSRGLISSRLLVQPAGGDLQSILEEISPEYSLEGLTLKLKLQSSGHLM